MAWKGAKSKKKLRVVVCLCLSCISLLLYLYGQIRYHTTQLALDNSAVNSLQNHKIKTSENALRNDNNSRWLSSKRKEKRRKQLRIHTNVGQVEIERPRVVFHLVTSREGKRGSASVFEDILCWSSWWNVSYSIHRIVYLSWTGTMSKSLIPLSHSHNVTLLSPFG